MAMASSLPPGFGGAVVGSLPALYIPHTNVLKQARVSKDVSWAAEDILCQVRLFAAEDPPAQSSIIHQDLLQAKQARFMHMINPVVPVDLPPGFGPSVPTEIKPVVAAITPQVPWRTPEYFKLDTSWLVMAGGESMEVSVQRQRENRTLEAVYPRPSAIPESPAELSEVQLPFDKDDLNTLIIPVVPLDEDDDLIEQDDVPTTSGEKLSSPPPGFTLTSLPAKSRNWFPEAPQENRTLKSVSSTTSALGPLAFTSRNISIPSNGIPLQSTNVRTGSLTPPTRTSEAGPDVVAAAAAAYAALAQSNDTTMIDRELLIKFLTNPSMLQNLSDKLAQNPPGTHSSLTSHAYDRPPGFGAPLGANGLGQAPQPGQGYAPRPLNMQALPPSSISPPIFAAQPVESGSGRSLSQRDDQYYKDLISQHGRKNEENVWGVGAIETGNSYPGAGRSRKLEKSDRTDRSERPDSGARWVERDDGDIAGLPGRQGDSDSRSGQTRGKSRKACIYFSTSRGCRNGSSCAFVHESSNPERAKRQKLEGKDISKGYRQNS